METIIIVITVAFVILAINNVYRRSPIDRKVYNYSATILDGIKDGQFKKSYQEVSIQRKHITFEGYINEKYSIIQINREKTSLEYICKDNKGVISLLLFDNNHQTLILIDKHQTGMIYSHDEPC